MVSKLWLAAMGTTARISLCDSRLFLLSHRSARQGRKKRILQFLFAYTAVVVDSVSRCYWIDIA